MRQLVQAMWRRGRPERLRNKTSRAHANILQLHAWLWLSSMAVVGCASPPDLEPFASATAQLHHGVIASQTLFREEFLAVTPDAHREIETFDREWSHRVAAMDALSDYADSLAAIAQANRNSRQAAREFAGSLEHFFGAMGVSGLAGSEAFAVGAELYGVIREAAAARSLSQAVNAAHPAIERATIILCQDIDAMIRTLRTAPEVHKARLETPQAQDREHAWNALVAQRDAMLMQLAHEWDDQHATLLPQLEQISAVLEAMRPWHESYHAALNAIDARSQRQIDMLLKIQNGLKQLSQLHGQLAAAIEQGRRPNVRLLLNTAIEIRDLLEQARTP